MTVNCREARDLLDPFLSDQLLVETMHAIVKHLETCAACRQEFDARRALRSRLQSAVAASPGLAPRPEFGAELRARLRPDPAVVPPMSRRAWLETWWAAAAALAAVLAGGLFTRDAVRRSRVAALAASAAGDHQNCALKFNLAERPIPLEDAARRYDAAYAPLVTLDAPARLAGGIVTVVDRHSCVFEGRRFAHIVYRYQEHLVSLLVTAGSRSSGATPALVPLPPVIERTNQAANAPLHVASFDAGSHAAFVVSDLPDQDVLAIARALASPLAQRLG